MFIVKVGPRWCQVSSERGDYGMHQLLETARCYLFLLSSFVTRRFSQADNEVDLVEIGVVGIHLYFILG